MEKKRSKKGLFALTLIFLILFGYVFVTAFLRNGAGCSGGPGAGSAAPDFKLPKMEGGEIGTADIKGKVLLLHFWATWCEPCRKELPALMSLLKRLKDRKDFALLAVSCDEEGTKPVKELFEKLNVELPVAMDPQRNVAFLLFGVSKFPESFLIDKKGLIRYKFIGPREWTEKQYIQTVEQLLAE